MSIIFNVACIYEMPYTAVSVWPLPMAARSKVWVCGRSFAAIAGSNAAGSTVSGECFVCCQVEVSTTGPSLIQRSPTECVCH